MTVGDANLELFGPPDDAEVQPGPGASDPYPSDPHPSDPRLSDPRPSDPRPSDPRPSAVPMPAGLEHATELFGDATDTDDAAAPSPAARNPDDVAPNPSGEGASRDLEVRRPPVWTVAMVNRRVRELMEGAVPPLWIRGEVANWTRARSGHRYFTLKDELAQIRAVMFRSDAERLPIDPDEGMTVRVFGSVTLYETRGEYQVTVRTLESEGDEGLWRIAFERVRLKLEKEGLLAPERKRPLPRFPRCVGVVTSPTGAALRDIVSVIGTRAPWVRIVVKSTRVQGDGAALEIAAAINALAERRTRGCGHRRSRWRLDRRSLGLQRRRCCPGHRRLHDSGRFRRRTRGGRHHRGSRC